MTQSASVGPICICEWFALAHMLSVMVPTKVCVLAACAADSAVSASAHTIRRGMTYSPGVIKCAVVVPAFMIQTPPPLPFSGSPTVACVAPGTAMVMCVRAISLLGPIR